MRTRQALAPAGSGASFAAAPRGQDGRSALLAAVEQALQGRHLLSHPFYQRWSRGELEVGELAAYAVQYRCVEAALPSWLVSIQDRTTSSEVRALVQRNLDDEVGGAVTHLELFDRFAQAVGAPEAGSSSPPTTATSALLGAHGDLVASSAAEGLAAVLAYELQAPEISASKAAGLRSHYGLDADAVLFWDTHAVMEDDHAAWTLDAVERAGGRPAAVATAARRAADAWWAFLDEREAAAPLGV